MKSFIHIKNYIFIQLLLLFPLSYVIAGNNLIPGDSSFESGINDLVLSSCHGYIQAEGTDLTAADGQCSVKLDFSGNDFTVPSPIVIAPELGGKKFTFSLYAKADKDNVSGAILVIKSDWSKVLRQEIKLSSKWQRFSCTDVLPGGTYTVAFLLKQAGTAWVDCFQLEQSENASAYTNNARCYAGITVPAGNRNIFHMGETIPIKIFGGVHEPAGKTGEKELRFQITGLDRKVIMSEVKKVPAGQPRIMFEYKFTIPANGWYRLTATLYDANKPIKETSTFLAAVNPPPPLNEGMSPFCGLSRGRNLDNIGGSRWHEMFFHWEGLEPQQGQYRFPAPPVRKAGEKIKLTIGHLPGAPAWAINPDEAEDCRKLKFNPKKLLPDPQYMDSWRSFIRALAQNYRGKIDLLEIGAEDDLIFGGNQYYLQKFPEYAKSGCLIGGPAFERYSDMVKAACEEIRKVTPEMKIGIVRPSNGDCERNFIFTAPVVKKCGNLFDILSLDCYTTAHFISRDAYVVLPDEFLPKVLTQALNMCEKNGNRQPVGVSEVGYAKDILEDPESQYGLQMVKYLVRSFLIGRMVPRVEFFHWYCTDGAIENGKYHYGLFRSGMPMPTVPAFAEVARVVENVVSWQQIKMPGPSRAVVFRKNNGADAALWFVRGSGTLKLSAVPKGLTAVDVMGNQIVLKNGTSPEIAVGEMPVYLHLEGNDASSRLAQILTRSDLISNPVNLAFVMKNASGGVLSVKNQIGKPLQIKLTVQDPSSRNVHEFALAADDTKTIEIPLRGMSPLISVTVDCGKVYSKISEQYPINLIGCPRFASPPQIDGNMDEWKSRPTFIFNQRSQIKPSDPWIDWGGPEQFSARIYTGWDDRFFYMAAAVKDERQCNSRRLPQDIWNGDALEFAFSSGRTFNAPVFYYAPPDCDLGIAATANGNMVAQWAGRNNVWTNAEYAIKRNEETQITVYEVKIPLANLGINPIIGNVVGFGIAVFNDNTGAGQNYYYRSCDGIVGGKRPDQLNRLVLTK